MTRGSKRLRERAEGQSKQSQGGMAARHGAVSLLDDVLIRHRPLDAAFAAQAGKGTLSKLSPRDRALARAIVATALRRKGQIEDIFSGHLERPLKGNTQPLMNIVLAAVAQLLFMGVSSHAGVNLAVEQCKKNPKTRRYGGLVNAVLRRIASTGAESVAAQDAAKLNTAPWLWDRWTAHYGDADARRIAEAHLAEPPLDLSVKSDSDGWAETLGGVALPTGSVRLRAKGRIEALAGFDDGAWWVQDAAAALPVRILGDVSGMRVGDLCAAPGGKTAQLVAGGAEVTAVDTAATRLAMLEANLARLGMAAATVEADALAWRPDEPFDAVLLDAPCSATGTIRRHPDIPHVKRDKDVGELADLQAKLLDHALTLIRPGGMLVYCTCSLEKEEGEAQIARLVARNEKARLVPIHPDLIAGREDWLTADGMLRTLPHFDPGAGDGLGGMDGFFAAKISLAA